MDETRKDLIETRRMVAQLIRTCRQSLTYLNGESCFGDGRMKQVLQKAITEAEKFLNRQN